MKTKATIKSAVLAICTILIGVLVNSCNEDLFLPEDIRNSIAEPEIHNFEPRTGSIGTEIAVTGRNLSSVIRAEIGGAPTEVIRRYTDYSLVLRLVGTEVTGPITLTNNRGTTSSAETFTVIDNIPQNIELANSDGSPFDETLVDEQRIVITGEQLSAVRRVTFGKDSVIIEGGDTTFIRAAVGRLIDRSETELIVEVPYLDVEFGYLATINLEYMAGGQLQTHSEGPFPVNNIFIAPTITNIAAIPNQTAPDRVITLRGTHLNRVSEVFLNNISDPTVKDSAWTIISQSRTELRVLVPNFIAAVTDGDITLIHNRGLGQAEEVVKFISIVNEGALDYVRFRNVRLEVQRPPGEENTANFFSATDGQVFTACDHATVGIDRVTTFFFDRASTGLRFNNPRNSVNVFPGFRCGTDVENPEVNQPLQGLVGLNATRFRTLMPTDAGDLALINRVKADAIDSIPLGSIYLDMLQGAAVNSTINNLGSSSAPWRRSVTAAADHNNWEIGDIVVFREYLNTAVPGTSTLAGIGDGGRFGFIQIVAIDIDGVNVTPSFTHANWAAMSEHQQRRTTITVNVWFQREAE